MNEESKIACEPKQGTGLIPGATSRPCRILSLDGGGSKGFYTLGVLREIEGMLDAPLCECFDLVFGTSTGAIVAALIALGHRVEGIHALYREHVPRIMKARGRLGRSAALAELTRTVFADQGFGDVKTRIGVVTTRWSTEVPMIFKGDIAQAHGRKGTFVPGFGVTVADAVRASCSAFPFFERTTVTTSAGATVELVDGGFCANNPTLYAIADAVSALHVVETDLRVVSIGVGVYPAPEPSLWMRVIRRYVVSVLLLQKTLEINTQSMEQLRSILFRNVNSVRISDVFDKPEMATDLLEHDLTKLDLLHQRGGESFASRESKLRELLLDGEENR